MRRNNPLSWHIESDICRHPDSLFWLPDADNGVNTHAKMPCHGRASLALLQHMENFQPLLDCQIFLFLIAFENILRCSIMIGSHLHNWLLWSFDIANDLNRNTKMPSYASASLAFGQHTENFLPLLDCQKIAYLLAFENILGCSRMIKKILAISLLWFLNTANDVISHAKMWGYGSAWLSFLQHTYNRNLLL